MADTVERGNLWRALTPQMFRYGALCAALDGAHAAGRFPSDEAQALEWLGQQPVLIAGAPSNLKVTTAEDLVHDTFVALPRAIRSFRAEASLRSFLIGVAVNHAKRHIRSAMRRRS